MWHHLSNTVMGYQLKAGDLVIIVTVGLGLSDNSMLDLV